MRSAQSGVNSPHTHPFGAPVYVQLIIQPVLQFNQDRYIKFFRRLEFQRAANKRDLICRRLNDVVVHQSALCYCCLPYDSELVVRAICVRLNCRLCCRWASLGASTLAGLNINFNFCRQRTQPTSGWPARPRVEFAKLAGQASSCELLFACNSIKLASRLSWLTLRQQQQST